MRVPDARQIAGARPVAELGEQHVIAAVRLALVDLGFGIADVAERDRLGGAGLLAGGADVAVFERALGHLGVDLRGLDPLHAIGALLHHAARAHGHVRVGGHLDQLGRVLGVVEEIEAPHLVRAVVRAVAGADAAVVDHRVQAVGGVHSRRHRADLLAGGVLALLAGHRLEHDLRLLGRAGEVAVHAQPVHLAAAAHLLVADDGYVVLALAGDHAGVAAGAGIEVDRHAPLLAFLVAVLLPERRLALRGLDHLGGEVRLVAPFPQGGLAHDLAPFHGAAILGLGDLVQPARGLEPGPAGEAGRRAGAQGVDVGADPGTGATGGAPAIAQVHDDGALG